MINTNAVIAAPGIRWILPLIRILSALSLFLLIVSMPGKEKLLQNLFLSAGIFFLMTSVIDMFLIRWIDNNETFFDVSAETIQRPSDSYDLSSLNEKDIVIVGDSHLVGVGMYSYERFSTKAGALLKERDPDSRVISLGNAGAGLDDYLDILNYVDSSQKVKRVILAFYMNDMPIDKKWLDQFRNSLISIRQSSQLAGFLGDVIGKRLIPSVNRYHDYIVESYDKNSHTYPARADFVEQRLSEFYRMAKERSTKSPVLMIIPLMVDFQNYPLSEAHSELRHVAQTQGYSVLDLLDVFTEKITHVNDYLLPGDSHLNPLGHTLIAEEIVSFLEDDSN